MASSAARQSRRCRAGTGAARPSTVRGTPRAGRSSAAAPPRRQRDPDVHRHRHVVVVLSEHCAQVLGRLLWGVVLLGPRPRPAARVASRSALSTSTEVGQFVIPGASCGSTRARGCTSLAQRFADRHRTTRCRAEHRLGDTRCVLDRSSTESTQQNVLHPQTHRGGVAVPREEGRRDSARTDRAGRTSGPGGASWCGDLLPQWRPLGHRVWNSSSRDGSAQSMILAAMAGLAVAGALDHRSSLLPQRRYPDHAF